MQASKVKPDARKALKKPHLILVTHALREEWHMWTYFLQCNKGAPWKNFYNVLVKAEVSSDASGRSYAGVVDFPAGKTMITAGGFSGVILSQDIQLKDFFYAKWIIRHSRHFWKGNGHHTTSLLTK